MICLQANTVCLVLRSQHDAADDPDLCAIFDADTLQTMFHSLQRLKDTRNKATKNFDPLPNGETTGAIALVCFSFSGSYVARSPARHLIYGLLLATHLYYAVDTGKVTLEKIEYYVDAFGKDHFTNLFVKFQERESVATPPLPRLRSFDLEMLVLHCTNYRFLSILSSATSAI